MTAKFPDDAPFREMIRTTGSTTMTQDKISDRIRQYVQTLRDNRIAIWRVYLFGSRARGTAHKESDIDLAVFLDQDEIDGFDEDVQLMHLTRDVDRRVEPHAFSRRDFENPDPFVREIIATGKRIL